APRPRCWTQRRTRLSPPPRARGTATEPLQGSRSPAPGWPSWPAPAPGAGDSCEHRGLEGLVVRVARDDARRAVDRGRRVLQPMPGQHAHDATLGAVLEEACDR